MRYCIIIALAFAIIGLMAASYATIAPLKQTYHSADTPQEYEPPMAPRCHDVRNCDEYIDGWIRTQNGRN